MHHFIGPVLSRLYLPQCNENCQQNRFSFPHVALRDYLKLPVTRILLRTNQNLFLSFSSKFDSQF